MVLEDFRALGVIGIFRGFERVWKILMLPCIGRFGEFEEFKRMRILEDYACHEFAANQKLVFRHFPWSDLQSCKQ